MTTITQEVSSLGDLPDIADPSTFETRMNALITAALPGLRNEINTWAGQANTMAGELAALAEISALLVGPGGSVSATRTALGAGATGSAIFSAATVAAVKALLPIQAATPVTLSGTSVDFTGIPSWVRKITIPISGMSTAGTQVPGLQLGDSGGIESSGYVGTTAQISTTPTVQISGSSSAFALNGVNVAAASYHGTATLNLLDPATNLWTFAVVLGRSDSSTTVTHGAGSKALSAPLDRIRLFTSDGFDGGSVTILYE